MARTLPGLASLSLLALCACAEGTHRDAIRPAPIPSACAVPSGEPTPSSHQLARQADSSRPIDAGSPNARSTRDAASGLATSAPDLPDPWIGLTYAQVRKATASDSTRTFGPPNTEYYGDPTVTVRGAEWTIEWEPGGCSDWTMAIVLTFSNGRVVRVATKQRFRSTGKECR